MKKIMSIRWLAFALILMVAAAMMPITGNVQAVSYGASKLSAPQALKAVSKGEHAIKLSWKKVKKAKGYLIYKYDGSTKKYKNVKTISAAKTKSWIDNGLTTNKMYKYKMRAYKTVKGKKVKGKYSYVVSAKPQNKKSSTRNADYVDLYDITQECYPSYSEVLEGDVDTNDDYSEVVSGKLVWGSSNPKVIKMTKNGTMTALRTGKAYITARSHNGITARQLVTVRNFSATINGKTISLGEKISSVNKKLGKYYMGNLEEDSLFKDDFGKGYKVYTYEIEGAPVVITNKGRVKAFATKEACPFSVLGIKGGASKSADIKTKLKKVFSYVEYESSDGEAYYSASNESYTANVLLDMSGGVVRGFALGGGEIPAGAAYYMTEM